jgi:hypothetical protein
MSDAWSSERILALAPDASSAKSGKDLANARKWVSFGSNDRALWGECQGSGAKPYQTQIDLSGPTFKCSCPSRKFPCKHSLGLFLLVTGGAKPPKPAGPPQWVEEWLASREQRAEAKAKKATEAAAAPVDPHAQAKRIADREKKVTAGVRELDTWLRDVVRQGLAAAQTQPYAFWESRASRLVDAQAPGLARLVRDMAGTASSGDAWQERLTRQLAQLHLALEGYDRQDALPPDVRADLRALVGWPQSQDELLTQPGVLDTWFVVGQRVTLEDRLRAQRTYLFGQQTGRSALLLQFAHGTSPFTETLLAGTRLDAELAFYPGALPLRAVLKQRTGSVSPIDHLPGHPTLTAAISAYARQLAVSPWTDVYPLPVRGVIPQTDAGRWWLVDTDHRHVPLDRRFAHGWRLLAVSGGQPIDVFGEWDGQTLLPLSAAANGEFMLLTTGEG